MTDSVFISIAIKVALILLIIYVVGLYKKYRDEKENLPSGNPSNDDEDTAGNVSNAEREPMQILISSLRELNADYKVNRLKDGDEVIYFTFQAENFSLQVSPDCYFCHMIDPVWHSFDVSDFNELALVKRVINDMNWVSPLNVVYTKSSDEKLYEINTTYNLFVDDSIPYPSYLYKVINDFFITKNTFFRMLAEEHGKEVSGKE
ncbi:MAG: hypothetical protein K6A78_07070 [Prevotella sp.]|nr:hypothetical protein [Prevotella sp.]